MSGMYSSHSLCMYISLKENKLSHHDLDNPINRKFCTRNLSEPLGNRVWFLLPSLNRRGSYHLQFYIPGGSAVKRSVILGLIAYY